MSSYYYLAAQLPYLTYGQGVPMTSGAFMVLAKEHLNAGDAAVLDHCTLDPGMEGGEDAAKVPSAFVRNWQEWERSLRLNLARNRAKKLKREGGFALDVPDTPFDAAAAARTASGMESPLEAEIFLDKARWDAIESFQGIDMFCEDAIFAYMLKLLLMERRTAFSTEEGFTEYKALYAAILGEPK